MCHLFSVHPKLRVLKQLGAPHVVDVVDVAVADAVVVDAVDVGE